MIKIRILEHRFVRSVPRELEPGVLYVSLDYATVMHSCCCGCGEQIVTPLSPTGWRITFDGESISLSPSVGNWYEKCRSHYVIDRGRILEKGQWSRAQIEAEHERDKLAKKEFYKDSDQVLEAEVASMPTKKLVSERKP